MKATGLGFLVLAGGIITGVLVSPVAIAGDLTINPFPKGYSKPIAKGTINKPAPAIKRMPEPFPEEERIEATAPPEVITPEVVEFEDPPMPPEESLQAAPEPEEEEVAPVQKAAHEPQRPAERVFWSGYAGERRWRAIRGANVREILNGWSQDSGVEFVWATDSNFPVLETVSIQGTYEQAVKVLLEQYRPDGVRPVANLHIDPLTGERALVVQAWQGG